MSYICCICCKQLSNDNHKDIFDENLLIKSQEKNINEDSDGNMTLRDAIQLIIGNTISEIDNAVLCETCFQKVEFYVKFQSQLVASLARLNNTQVSYTSLPNSENVEIVKTLQISKISEKASKIQEEIVNINKNTSTNSHDVANSDSEIDDTLYSNLLPNVQHFADSSSDLSSDFNDNVNIDVSHAKIQKIDIESDVNVCSGEDNGEILELAVQYRRNETVSTSSTESEEDNDYGPTIKRTKLSNSISIFL